MILVSACLCGINCRYDGVVLKFHHKLKKYKNILPLCPEQLAGFPTPRPAVNIVKGRYINVEGFDVTENFRRGAKEVLKIAKRFKVKVAYLKSKSPSCGEDGLCSNLLKKSGIKIFWL